MLSRWMVAMVIVVNTDVDANVVLNSDNGLDEETFYDQLADKIFFEQQNGAGRMLRSGGQKMRDEFGPLTSKEADIEPIIGQKDGILDPNGFAESARESESEEYFSGDASDLAEINADEMAKDSNNGDCDNKEQWVEAVLVDGKDMWEDLDP